MNTGFVAALVGVAATVLAWFLGRISGKKETIREVKTQETIHKAESEKAIAQDTARIVSENVADKTAIDQTLNEFEGKLKEHSGDEDYMAEAAQFLADIANGWKDRNK